MYIPGNRRMVTEQNKNDTRLKQSGTVIIRKSHLKQKSFKENMSIFAVWMVGNVTFSRQSFKT